MLNKQKVLFLLAVFVCLHIYAQDKHFWNRVEFVNG